MKRIGDEDDLFSVPTFQATTFSNFVDFEVKSF